jgi:hypothetical protein
MGCPETFRISILIYMGSYIRKFFWGSVIFMAICPYSSTDTKNVRRNRKKSNIFPE